jgi:hypothetical protein
MKTKTYQFRANQEESEALDSYCEKEGQTVSEAIRMLIGEKLFYWSSNQPKNIKDTGAFTNNQDFKVGQKVRFWGKNKDDKFAGVHIVKRVRYDKVNKVWGIQTDISQKVASPKDLYIAVHWFEAV